MNGPDITPEMVEALKARDGRFAAIDRAISVEAELASSKTLALVIAVARVEAQRALESLADVSPSDRRAIIDLQAKVYFNRIVETTINRILEDGKQAAGELKEQSDIATDTGQF